MGTVGSGDYNVFVALSNNWLHCGRLSMLTIEGVKLKVLRLENFTLYLERVVLDSYLISLQEKFHDACNKTLIFIIIIVLNK